MVLTNDNADSRRIVEHCYARHKVTINPIIEWTDKDVWDFIRAHGLRYCSLYDEGFLRLGCIGCPNCGRRLREQQFKRWPKFLGSYLFAFSQMLKVLKQKPDYTGTWKHFDSRDIYNWWMEYDVIPGQIPLEEFE